jgi:hypothetical protein
MHHFWNDWQFDPKLNEDIFVAINNIPDPELKLTLFALKTKWNQTVKLTSLFADSHTNIKRTYDPIYSQLYSKIDRV